MTVIEIALLRLVPGVVIDSPDLRSELQHAKTVMQNYTGRTFYYFQQVEDPSYIYIVGEWDSLSQHMNEFIPSAENQTLLQSLKDMLKVEWLIHINNPNAELPLPGSKKPHQREVVLGIVRHFIKDGERDGFQQTFKVNEHYLQDYVTQGRVVGGWCIDREDDKQEWVLLTPWESVEQHDAFRETRGFIEYSRIRDYIDSTEIKHATVLDI
jgi:quinol monooxygenase YgiN